MRHARQAQRRYEHVAPCSPCSIRAIWACGPADETSTLRPGDELAWCGRGDRRSVRSRHVARTAVAKRASVLPVRRALLVTALVLPLCTAVGALWLALTSEHRSIARVGLHDGVEEVTVECGLRGSSAREEWGEAASRLCEAVRAPMSSGVGRSPWLVVPSAEPSSRLLDDEAVTFASTERSSE